MTRTADSIRTALSQPLDANPQFTRLVRASLLREALRLTTDRYAARRCRSVREQQRWEARETDGLPIWL